MDSTEKYVCVDCGWSEERHGYISPEDRPKASAKARGYSTARAECQGYRKSKGERNATARRQDGYGNQELPFVP